MNPPTYWFCFYPVLFLLLCHWISADLSLFYFALDYVKTFPYDYLEYGVTCCGENPNLGLVVRKASQIPHINLFVILGTKCDIR